MDVLIRKTLPQDITEVVKLQRICFPPPFEESLLWNEAHISEHIQVFPEGQFVAEIDSTIVASSTAIKVSESNWQAHQSWEDSVGGHYLRAHDPNGNTLYGVDISVNPGFRRLGIGRALYKARFQLVRELELERFGTACRIPGWQTWSAENGNACQEAFCVDVLDGLTSDRTLTPLLSYGLEFMGIIENFMEDEESGNCAAILEWRP